MSVQDLMMDSLYKKISASGGALVGGKRNKWLSHVKKYRRDHPGMSYKMALRKASRSYGGDMMMGGRRKKRRPVVEEEKGFLESIGEYIPGRTFASRVKSKVKKVLPDYDYGRLWRRAEALAADLAVPAAVVFAVLKAQEKEYLPEFLREPVRSARRAVGEYISGEGLYGGNLGDEEEDLYDGVSEEEALREALLSKLE